MSIPTREDALQLLNVHVKEGYQILHAKMVATALEKYAEKFNEDRDIWYLTGLLHDIDYYEHPDKHPYESLKWFEEWDYPVELIYAVKAHSPEKPRAELKSNLDKALIAIDELAGLIYAYSLMRPTGFEGMKPKSVKKKFRDKSFAAKIDREEIMYGVDALGVDFSEHINLLVESFSEMPEFGK